MTETRADEAEAIKQSTAQLFDRAASQYDQQEVGFFRQLGRELVTIAQPQPGERVVDVGCGRGAVLIPVREAVGESGLVHAFDLAPSMVELCRKDVHSRGWTNVSLHVDDAEDPQLPEQSFDLVVSGLVLFFLPNPERGLAAYWHALRPDGRLAFSSFGAEDPRFAPVFQAMIEHMPPPEEEPLNASDDITTPARDPKSHFASTSGVTALLEHVGYENVSHIEKSYDFGFSTPEEWIEWSWTNGARMMWEAIAEDKLDAATNAVQRELQLIAEERGGVIQQWNLRYTVAERPVSGS